MGNGGGLPVEHLLAGYGQILFSQILLAPLVSFLMTQSNFSLASVGCEAYFVYRQAVSYRHCGV